MTVNNTENSRSDSEVNLLLLTALKNIRKNNPRSFKEEYLIVDGFCKVLGINYKQYEYCASLLHEDQLISEGIIGRMHIGDGGIYITSKGIRFLDNEQNGRMKSGTNSLTKKHFEYDVAISFAGEDRDIAEKIASELKARDVKVFYDAFEEANLWGKNLYDYLSYIYSESARYCVMILSAHYAKKAWTSHERQNAQERAFREKEEYILPIRLDETKIPGILDTVGYISLDKSNLKTKNIADLIIEKLKTLERVS